MSHNTLLFSSDPEPSVLGSNSVSPYIICIMILISHTYTMQSYMFLLVTFKLHLQIFIVNLLLECCLYCNVNLQNREYSTSFVRHIHLCHIYSDIVCLDCDVKIVLTSRNYCVTRRYNCNERKLTKWCNHVWQS